MNSKSFRNLDNSEKPLWTEAQVSLLSIWAEKCSGYRWLHMRSKELYVRQNNYFSIPIVIMSTTIGMGGFASISPTKPTFFEYCIQIVLAVGNIIVAVMTAVYKYNSFPERIEQHRNASILYSKVYREISMELSLPVEYRHSSITFCRDIQHKYDKLINDTPDVPQHVIEHFNKTFPSIVNRPDLCNGLFDLNRCNLKKERRPYDYTWRKSKPQPMECMEEPDDYELNRTHNISMIVYSPRRESNPNLGRSVDSSGSEL